MTVKPWVQRLVRILAILLLIGSLGLGWLWLDYRAFLDEPVNVPAHGLEFRIERGSNVRRIAAALASQGVISQPTYLVVLARLEPELHPIRAGVYAIKPGTRPRELLAQFVAGKVLEFSVQFIEGWSFRQLRAELASAPRLKQTLTGLSDDEVMARLGHAGEHPEGRFFPDTYRYPVEDSDIAVLRRAYNAMSERLDRAWAQRDADLPYKSPYEALIMASIVEKETGVAEERPAIAGVFVRRLRLGMRMDTDPSVIYGMGERYDGNIRKKDLTEATPYNTYIIPGLPPTPIAMPGAQAIHAALHPAPGKALYFVAKGDGTHYFSDTLSEHNAAVRRYQLKK